MHFYVFLYIFFLNEPIFMPLVLFLNCSLEICERQPFVPPLCLQLRQRGPSDERDLPYWRGHQSPQRHVIWGRCRGHRDIWEG